MSVTKTLTSIAHDWAVRCFGISHVNNQAVRALRTLEETAELAQAIGLPVEQAHKCIDRVYERPAGDVNQEIGGVMVTLNVLCESMGKDSEALFEAEVRRVLKKSPEHFAKRNQEKIDLGLDGVPKETKANPEPCSIYRVLYMVHLGYVVYRHVFDESKCTTFAGAEQHKMAVFNTEIEAIEYCMHRNRLIDKIGSDALGGEL